MIRVLVILFWLVGFGALSITGIGLLEPIDSTVEEKAYFSDSPEDLYDTIIEFEKWPEWMPLYSKVERLSEGRYLFQEKVGLEEVRIFEATRPPYEFALKLEGTSFKRSGDWQFDLKTSSGGTFLTISEKRSIMNPMGRFWYAYVEGPTKVLRAILDGIKVQTAPHP